MDANKFMAEYQRMCNSYAGCRDCPLHTDNRLCTEIPSNYPEEFAAKLIKIVEEWSAAHPRKTRQDVFLEQWPNAARYIDGVVNICPKLLDVNVSCTDEETEHTGLCKACDDCRREFWTKVVG